MKNQKLNRETRQPREKKLPFRVFRVFRGAILLSFILLSGALAGSAAQPPGFKRSSDSNTYPYMVTMQAADMFLTYNSADGTNNNYSGTNYFTQLTNTSFQVASNIANLMTNGWTATATNIANYAATNNYNGTLLTNIQCTNIVLVTKAAFSTNYTVRLVDQVLACTGTNQLLTLPNGTNGVTTGTIFCFLMSSTTGYGSAIITNANGVQTVLTAAALSQTITNGQSLTILWDGNNWR